MRQLVLGALLLSIAASANAAIPSSERDALVALYQSTGGASWSERTNWLGEPGTECDWYGIDCDETGANVTEVSLYANNLEGSVPASIANLTKVRYLLLGNNDLHGPIPPQIGQLAQLERFYGDAAGFTGNIPQSFASLKKLTFLNLRSNSLSGTLPAFVGDYPDLEELYLDGNQFSGAIPADLAKLTKLKHLELANNRFTGTIPAALGSLPQLQTLTLSGNQLTGSIPSELGNLANLVTLRLGFNDLTGTLPAALGQLEKLETLAVEQNELTGELPVTIGRLDAIKVFDVRNNHMSGALPSALFQMTTVQELLLASNQFSGPLSPDITKLGGLQVLVLYDNQFSGAIPPQLGSIAPLRSLELAQNAFTGTIPVELSQLTNLTWLDLASNDLTGSIPPQLGALSKLDVLSMYGNALTGTIPPELGQLSDLRLLLLGQNALTGSIPDALRNLHRLEQFNVNGNDMSGPLPSWIGEWVELRDLFLGENDFSGTLPAALATLDDLAFLELGQNQFHGPLPDFTRLTNLIYLTANDNHFSGALPPSIGLLSKLDFFTLARNDLSGTLPPQIGGLTAVTYFDLSHNEFSGALPKELANLKNAYTLGLHENHFSGSIPKELAQLTTLQYLSLSFNALTGAIPPEITAMTGLADHASDFAYNGLFAPDANTRAFVNLKHYDGDFEQTQTIKPSNVKLVSTTDRSATLSWDPIRYTWYGGGYQVSASTTPNGPAVVLATTSDKSAESFTIRNLQPSTTYYFTVATVSHPVSQQENLITSDRTAPVQGVTKPRVLAPAEVVMTDAPNGLVRIDDTEVQADSFTLTNFGDVATSITVAPTENFFTVAPLQFTLNAGASQILTLHSTSQNPGTYYGYVSIDGAGVPDDLYASVTLLASTRPSGSVVATALDTRIELAGAPGSDEVGVAQFRNSGTARLTGIVVSDQPWVEVSAEPLTIDPGQIGSVNFTIVRAKRPAGAEGALIANLSLIYVSGTSDARSISALATTAPGVQITKVTIVDITQPNVSTGSIPALLTGEIPFFIPGLTNAGTTRSDLSIVNATGAASIDDLKLYFTGGSTTSIASLQPLPFARAIDLVNILGNVYGAQGSGALQLRSASSANLNAGAKVTMVTDDGTYSGAVPVFRGRGPTFTAPVYLTGLKAGGDLFVQETEGSGATIAISFLDANGNPVSSRNESVGGYRILELKNAIPANAATAKIERTGGTISAYARLYDANGDSWSVVDWGQFYDYVRTSTVRVPFADGRIGSPRRRVVRHGVATEATTRRKTNLTIFNPSDSEARVRMQIIDSTGRATERTQTIAAKATVTVTDIAASAATSVAHVTLEPERGSIVVSARTSDANGGSAIPVLAAGAGIRLGQSQAFSGLDDSAAQRTGYGFTESGGATAKVRARIIITETNALVSTVTERTFTLAAHEEVYLPELVRSFAGGLRDTAYGDLHGLVLEVEVIEGTGAVVPFVMTTDLGTEDVSVHVQ